MFLPVKKKKENDNNNTTISLECPFRPNSLGFALKVLIRFASFIHSTVEQWRFRWKEREHSHFEMMCVCPILGICFAYLSGLKTSQNAEAVGRVQYMQSIAAKVCVWVWYCVCNVKKRNVQEISISRFYGMLYPLWPLYRNLFHMFIILHALMCFASFFRHFFSTERWRENECVWEYAVHSVDVWRIIKTNMFEVALMWPQKNRERTTQE